MLETDIRQQLRMVVEMIKHTNSASEFPRQSEALCLLLLFRRHMSATVGNGSKSIKRSAVDTNLSH